MFCTTDGSTDPEDPDGLGGLDEPDGSGEPDDLDRRGDSMTHMGLAGLITQTGWSSPKTRTTQVGPMIKMC